MDGLIPLHGASAHPNDRPGCPPAADCPEGVPASGRARPRGTCSAATAPWRAPEAPGQETGQIDDGGHLGTAQREAMGAAPGIALPPHYLRHPKNPATTTMARAGEPEPQAARGDETARASRRSR